MDFFLFQEVMSWVSSTFTYTPNHNFHGKDSFLVLSKDESGAVSQLLTIQIAVLVNPCINEGVCGGIYFVHFISRHLFSLFCWDLYYTPIRPFPGTTHHDALWRSCSFSHSSNTLEQATHHTHTLKRHFHWTHLSQYFKPIRFVTLVKNLRI